MPYLLAAILATATVLPSQAPQTASDMPAGQTHANAAEMRCDSSLGTQHFPYHNAIYCDSGAEAGGKL